MSENNMQFFRIDKEIQSIKLPLLPRDYAQLEQQLLSEGCKSPLIIWNDILIDGYHRYEICIRHNLPFSVLNLCFPCRQAAIAWICKKQLCRTDLSDEARRFLIGLQCISERAANIPDRLNEATVSSFPPVSSGKTWGNNIAIAEQIANENGNWMHRGQKVKILDKHFAGQVGTIHAFIWNTGQYIVAMENGHTLPFNPSELEKVDERKLPFSKQVQSASIRATEAHASAAIDIKKLCEAYNRSDLEALLYLKNFCVGNDSRLIEDLINANLNFYEEGYHRKTAINNEGEYHVKKWDLFERFGVTRGLDDQMVPAIINAPTKDAINDR